MPLRTSLHRKPASGRWPNRNTKRRERWTGRLNSDRDEDSTETFDKTVGLQHKEEDSGFSFSLDLGPSILDDVLQVMDKLHK
ncbi:hypothetical protein KUCAC02_026078 [Chaenocephalus aceratus]|uniref:Uncharacterized protein n=1 Tax=Chaenocephalus aceratus TaxID=36190 RepID=A0ACB9VWG5_CHAAC|nr:hypothetical protein KUCAC02_026078 [Chaenocephalus aceratus]